ncbi:MAG: helix-hairpin-helix domain-containing protein [Selenomonadaceae bacterium]|nr:helix-hairpin-helix domain-containing protein [Selenomonadaceae bacterium]
MKHLFSALALSLSLLAAAPAFANSANPFELNNASVEDLTSRCFFSEELAYKILDLRDSMGGFQSWDDLKELKLDAGQESILKSEATISGIQADCGC